MTPKPITALTPIWAIFTVANAHDQPDHNLLWWSHGKPTFERLLDLIGGDLANEKSIIAAAQILQGHDTSYGEDSYHLKEIKPGSID